MSQPINYYIQLDDYLASNIDALDKTNLIFYAQLYLEMYHDSDDYLGWLSFDGGRTQVDFPHQNLPKLAYGCLAKAV